MKSPSLKEVKEKVEALEREIHLQRPILEAIRSLSSSSTGKENF